MTLETRFATAEDLPSIWDVFVRSFDFPPDRFQEWLLEPGPERVFGAFDEHGRAVAGSRLVAFGQWYGGRRVPMAGYSPVAVTPEHRGRGLGRAVTAGQYADMRDRGEVAAGLFPSSVALYRSVGFELAGGYVERRIPSAHLASITGGSDVVIRPGGPEDVASARACYDRIAPTRHGHLDRPEEMWRRKVPADLSGMHLYVVDGGTTLQTIAGYAIYRHVKTRPPYDYAVHLVELMADDPAVSAALWRLVGSSGTQAPHVIVVGPPDDPVYLHLPVADPVAVQSEISWMVRLIDVARAVAARGYRRSARARVDLQIADPDAPWNAGRWVLEASDGAASLKPGGDGTVETSIGGLSSLWAGYAPARRLAAAGLLRTSDPVALDDLDDVFAGPSPALLDFY